MSLCLLFKFDFVIDHWKCERKKISSSLFEMRYVDSSNENEHLVMKTATVALLCSCLVFKLCTITKFTCFFCPIILCLHIWRKISDKNIMWNSTAMLDNLAKTILISFEKKNLFFFLIFYISNMLRSTDSIIVSHLLLMSFLEFYRIIIGYALICAKCHQQEITK